MINIQEHKKDCVVREIEKFIIELKEDKVFKKGEPREGVYELPYYTTAIISICVDGDSVVFNFRGEESVLKDSIETSLREISINFV